MDTSDLPNTSKPSQQADDGLLDIARCPFATTAELHDLNGRVDQRNVRALRKQNLIQDIAWYPDNGRKSVARHFLSACGMRRLSRRLRVEEAEFLRKYPASAEWQKWLLERIEMVALVYRVAVQIAQAGTTSYLPVEVQFPRAGPLDGIVSYKGGSFYGVMRQGYGLSLSSFKNRLSRQGRMSSQPARIFVVAADGFDKPLVHRHLRELRATLSGIVTAEDELIDADADSPVWTLPTEGAHSSTLRECVGDVAGSRTATPRVKTSYVRAALPRSPSEVSGKDAAELTGAQRRSLRDVFSWPLMDVSQLAALHGLPYSNEARILKYLLGLNLVEKIRVRGLRRRRFVISDDGWRYISDRDGVDLKSRLERWSVGNTERPMGTTLAQLIKEGTHTEGVNSLASALAEVYGEDVRLLPAHRSRRLFSYRGRNSQVVPDVVATVFNPYGGQTLFFEYELRATTVRDLTRKLLPWLRYFGAHYPYEDFAGTPRLLFVLTDEDAEERFLDIARECYGRTGMEVPLMTTTRGLFEGQRDSLARPIWLMSGNDEITRSTPSPESTSSMVRASLSASGAPPEPHLSWDLAIARSGET